MLTQKQVLYELSLIETRIPYQTHRTIVGQIRAGDLKGASVGIERLKYRLARKEAAEHENRSRK